MFSQDGDYSWEEAKVVEDEIQRLAIHLDKTEGTLLSLLKEPIPKSFFTNSINSESLQYLEKKLILKRQSEIEVTLLQNRLKTTTYRMKAEGKSLTEEMDYCMYNSDNYDGFKILLEALVENLKARQSNLMFPDATEKLEICKESNETDPVKDANKKKVERKDPEKRVETKSDKSKTSSKKNGTVKQTVDFDYKSKLFNFTNIDQLVEKENNYLSMAKYTLMYRLGKLQDILKEIATIDANRPDGAEAVADSEYVLKNYLHELHDYNLQVEEIWLSQVTDFLQQIVMLQYQCNEFVEEAIEQIIKEKMNELYKIQLEYKEDMVNFCKTSKAKRKSIESNLKPILGTLKNKDILNKVDESAKEANCDLAKESIIKFTNFKDTLLNLMGTYIETIEEKMQYLESILEYAFNSEIFDKITQNLLTIKTLAMVDALPIPFRSSIPIAKQVRVSFKTSDVRQARLNHIEYLVSRVFEKLLQLGITAEHIHFKSDDLDSDLILEEDAFLIKPFPIRDVLESAKQTFSNSAVQAIEMAETENNDFLEETKSWIKTWTKNVDKVKKLYEH